MTSTLKTVGKLSFLKFVGAITALVYSILQVRYFGANGKVDAYFVATSALYLVTALTQSGALSEVFLPEYLKVKENHGITSANRLLSAVMNRVGMIIAVILVLLFFLAPWIISIMGPGLEKDNQELAASLFQASLIIILFSVIASFINATLNAEEVFGKAEITALINSTISLILLIAFHEIFGIWILIYSLLVGKLLEFLIGIVFLKRMGFRYQLALNTEGYDLNQFFKILYTTSGYVGVSQFFNIVLTALASTLPEGTFSIYKYVRQIANRSRNLIATPINTVFFSKFSKNVAQGKELTNSYLRDTISSLMIIGVFQICLVIALGEPLLRFLWGEKTLTAFEYQLAYVMLILNFIGSGFAMVGAIFRKSVIALNGAKRIYLFRTLGQTITLVFTILVILGFGPWGLATIPLFNLLVLNGLTVWVAYNMGVNIKSLYKKVIIIKLTLFILLALISMFLIRNTNLISSSSSSLLVLKGICAVLFYFMLLFVFFKKRLISIFQDLSRTKF